MKKLLTPIRITEIGDVSNRLVELYKGSEPLQNDEFLKGVFAQLKEQGKAITEAVKKDKAVSHLEEADTKRDEAIRILSKLLKGYENIPLEDLKTHGEKLSAVFKKYGVKITEENYSSQSNLIDSLLLDFSEAEIQPSIEALSGVRQAIEGVRTSQEHFAKVRSQYEKEISQIKATATASSLRKPILELINKKLIPYLVAMELTQPERYLAFINQCIEIIGGMNETIKARSKSKTKAKS